MQVNNNDINFTMDICVRKIEYKDIESFRHAIGSVAKEKKYILTVETPSHDKVFKFVSDNIEKKHAQYIAIQDEQVIGWADIIPYEKEVLSHAGQLGMGVLKDYRGKGVGTQLLSSVMKHSWDNGLTRLELEVFSDNTNAIGLYKKHGFILEGTKKYARFLKNEYHDILIMAQYRI